MKSKYILILILAIAFALRVFWINKFPIGFTQDEAALGYDAYSILKTGRDQWGQFLPLTLRSLGDFKLPLYSYLAIPSVAIFGLNEFAVRLPSAFFGTLAVLFTYLLVKVMTRQKDSSLEVSKETFALAASLLLAISPWHIGLSRGAFEANLTSLLIPLGFWAYLKGKSNSNYFILSAIAFGLNLFSYHSARLFTPIFVMGLITYEIYSEKIKIQNFLMTRIKFIVVLVFFIILVVLSFAQGGGTRNADLAISNPTDQWDYLTQRRFEGAVSGEGLFVARLFSNKFGYIADQFVSSYTSYLSPNFLFVSGAGDWNYGLIPGRGLLYLIEFAFVGFALYSIVRKKGFPYATVILFWILLAPLSASLAKGPPFSANRIATMMPAIQILSAFGMLMIARSVNLRLKSQNLRTLFASLVAIVVAVSLISYLEDYYFHTQYSAAKPMNYGMDQAVDFAENNKKYYDKVFFSRSLSAPNIFVQFYGQWDPSMVQKDSKEWLNYEKLGILYLDLYDGYKLGDYEFGSVGSDTYNSTQKILIAGRPGEFPDSVNKLKVISYPNNEPAIEIVSNH